MTVSYEPGVSAPDVSAFVEESIWRKTPGARQRLMIIYAHPDDESFGNAGTIVRYTAAGADVHYLCGTRGECGEMPPALLEGYADIAARRTAELRTAAEAINLSSVHFLGYRDSGMEGSADNQNPRAFCAQPLDVVTGQVVGMIRTLRPQVLLTFNAYGGYGHPDHIVAHKATMRAFREAADPNAFPEQIAAGLEPWQPEKLYFSTFGTFMLRSMIAMARLSGRDPRRFGQNNDIDLTKIVGETTVPTTVIDSTGFLKEKEAAWAAHASQQNGRAPMQRLPEFMRRRMFATESFTRVSPEWMPRPIEHDLFAGVQSS